jgi:hypothetical protein
MHNFQITIGSLFIAAVISASPAKAERWVTTATDSTVPVGSKDSTICVDMDSVKTSTDGWTSYRETFCGDPLDIWEDAVQCNQNFSVEKLTMRTQDLVINKKPTPDKPWKTIPIYVTSSRGKTAKLICHKE